MRGQFSVTYSGSACVLDHLVTVTSLLEDGVKVVHKVTVVDQTACGRSLVLLNELICLLLSESDTKSADASAELKRKERGG